MSIIYGINSVLEGLKAPANPIEKIWLEERSRNPRLRMITGLARAQGITVQFEKRAALDRRAGTGSHQGVVAAVPGVRYAGAEEIFQGAGKPAFFLILDGIEDPHNLGAIVRTAEGAGLDGIFIPQRRAVGITEVVMKTSAGAAAHVRIARVTNIASLMLELKEKNLWVIGVDAQASSYWTEVDYCQPIAVVVGGEGKGLHRLVRERCDFLVRIPMRGKVESLNASVATGIVLYEAIRQRIGKDSVRVLGPAERGG